jgi:hypothetical protein
MEADFGFIYNVVGKLSNWFLYLLPSDVWRMMYGENRVLFPAIRTASSRYGSEPIIGPIAESYATAVI